MTQDLIDFLRARLDEDHAAAEVASVDPDLGSVVDQVDYTDKTVEAAERHIARHLPARVLREVEAKQGILLAHQQVMGDGWCSTCDVPGDVAGPKQGCRTVRLVASVYADHPDYRQEWAP